VKLPLTYLRNRKGKVNGDLAACWQSLNVDHDVGLVR